MFSLFHSVPWIHVTPAIIGVIVGFLCLKTKWGYLKVLFSFLWLLLLPNTAYIFTDVVRITLHWNTVSIVMRVALIIQYIILELIGLMTFFLAMLPLESLIHTKHFSEKSKVLIIVLLNFLIGFGMVLGRTGYTNSYVIFTRPTKVFFAAINIITSFYLVGLTIIFGIICNCIYFLFRNKLLDYAKKQKLL